MESELGMFLARLDVLALKGTKPKEHLQSYSFQELYIDLIGKVSYRSTADTVNKFLHRSGSSLLRASTLENRIDSLGAAISCAYENKARDILESMHVDSSTGIAGEGSSIPIAASSPDLPEVLGEKHVRGVMAEYNRGRDSLLKLRYNDLTANIESSQERCCYITIDDVGVKSQKPSRKGNSKRERKYVENTVIHIQSDEKQYTVTAVGMDKAFKLLLAFLLENNLMEDRRLIFLTDGAVSIRERINSFFGFRQHTVILDWLHLDKKCYEYMSMAVRGSRQEKEGLKKTLSAILWTGSADKALKFLNSIKKGNVKNTKKFEELKNYISRKAPNLACYALRHELGLRVSSNRVEKENDLIVASRQKHNGMSWSEKGSGALAIISAANRNNELRLWITSKQIQFRMVA